MVTNQWTTYKLPLPKRSQTSIGEKTMRISYFFIIILGLIFAIFSATYYWFWEPATLTLFEWIPWLSTLGVITLMGSLLFYKWKPLAYVQIVVTALVAIILLIFHLWVLYSYMILYTIEIWDIVGIIDLMFLTNNVWILPIAALIGVAIALHYVRLYAGEMCDEMKSICPAK